MRRTFNTSSPTSFFTPTTRKDRRLHPRSFRPLPIWLEERTLLSTIQVTSTSDRPFAADSVLTLRDAILLVDGGLTVGQLSPAQQALVAGTPDQPGVTDAIDFNIPFNDPGHVYYKDDGNAGSVSTADIVPVPTVAIDGVTPITSDAQLADPNLVGAGNTIDPDWSHSWWSINPTFTLPALTSPVTIDGYSQMGSIRNSLAVGDNAVLTIELNGKGAVPADFPFYGYATGLDIAADNTTVQGLVVNRFDYSGIGVPGNGNGGPTGVAIQGCSIGTDPSGTVARPNGYVGIACSSPVRIGTNGDGIDDTGGGLNDYAERNIISGNGVYGVEVSSPVGVAVVAGNYIGTDRTGTIAIPNGPLSGGSGVVAGEGSRVGVDGHDADPIAERNVISGNDPIGGNFNGGVLAFAGSVIAGNYIGIDATGLQPLGNGGAGVVAEGGALIGTDGDGVGDEYERNVISGNYPVPGQYGTGILVFGSGNEIAGNYIGTDPTGTFSIGDQHMGVMFWGGSQDNVLGYDSQNPVVDPGAQSNVISGNSGYGVDMLGDHNVVAGNFIGTDATGTAPVPNGRGIELDGGSYNRFGTDSDGVGDELERNIISGNADNGLVLNGGDYNVVAGNYIGPDVTGLRSLGNGGYSAVYLSGGTGNRIGVDGTSADPAAGRNVITGTGGGAGVQLIGTGQTIIAGNDIGTDPTGTRTVDIDGHTFGLGYGILVQGATSTLIGSHDVGDNLEGNIIGGDRFGVWVWQAAAGTVIAGNWIGTNPLGDNLGNGSAGVVLDAGTTTTQVGGPGLSSNTIAFNGWEGVLVAGLSTGNSIRGNSIYSNGLLGIDLSGVDGVPFYPGDGVTLNDSHAGQPGPNNWQTFPVLSAAYAGPLTLVTGTLHSTPNTTFAIDFYANPAPDPSGYGQGQLYLGSTTATTDSSGNASFTATALGAASPGEWISATATDPGGDTSELCQDMQSVPAPAVLVLNPTASGALTLSGNASVNIPGLVVVDSTSKTALSAAGNAQVTASAIDVAGGVQRSGNASFQPAPTTGISPVPDRLAGLTGPSTTGLTNYGSKSLGGNSQATIDPGIYSQISVSGNARLTMNSGIYVIEGGGFTVTGNASVSGSGVMIYNAGRNYPGTGGTFGGITLSGDGSFNLWAPTSGTYAGILIFQSRENTRALSFSGTAMAGTSGAIYAANALLSMSGNASLQNPLDVGMLNLSGNVSLTQTAAGSDGSGDTSGIANTLLAGNLSVYINDPSGLFTSDELARIQGAINTWDAILVPYNVTITEVSDPSQANMTIDTGSTSACGSAADGVLGCFNAPNAEITLLQGWNWYAGSDPSQIGANQYDFETTVLHELGHALGLGGSTDPTSPMYETLAAGVADRTVTTQDLNIPDPPDGADPQMAARFSLGSPVVATVQAGHVGTFSLALGSEPAAMMALSSGQWPVVSGQPVAAEMPTGLAGGPEPSLVVQRAAPDSASGHSTGGSQGDLVLDWVLADLATEMDRSRDGDGASGDVPRSGDQDIEYGTEPVGIPSEAPRPAPIPRTAGIPVGLRDPMGVSRRPAAVSDDVLAELAAVAAGLPGRTSVKDDGRSVSPRARVTDARVLADPSGPPDRSGAAGGLMPRLAVTLFAVGLWGRRRCVSRVANQPPGTRNGS